MRINIYHAEFLCKFTAWESKLLCTNFRFSKKIVIFWMRVGYSDVTDRKFLNLARRTSQQLFCVLRVLRPDPKIPFPIPCVKQQYHPFYPAPNPVIP